MSSRRDLRELCQRVFDHAGDAIEGERIIAQARDVGKPLVIPGTSSHRMREIVLKVNALCVVDRAFRFREGGFTLKEPSSPP